MRTRVAIGLALGFGLAAICFAAHIATASLAGPLARALETSLGLPAGSVECDDARLLPPAKLRVSGLRLGRYRVGTATLALDPLAALSRQRRFEHLRVTLGELELPGASAREVGLEIEHHQLQRIAVAGGRIERFGHALDRLVGQAVRDPAAPGATPGWRVRAARPGLVLAGRVRAGELVLEAELDRLPLAALFLLAPSRTALARGAGLEPARASGSLTVRADPGGLFAEGRLTLAELSLRHPSVARRPIGPFQLALEGDARLEHGVFTLDHLEVALAESLKIELTGRADASGAFQLEATLPRLGCQPLLGALPRDLVPALDGLTLSGALAGRAALSGELQHLDGLALSVDLDVGCRVLVDPPLADAHALLAGAGPVLVRATDEHGAPRPFPLGAAHPSFRPLSSLPLAVVKAFLISEDGRFFHHHGFDLEMIRRAVAADLQLGRFDRGASTISQQTVKNLFLSGERTAARKLEEAVLTWRLEQVVSKRRILELYLNLVELGPGVYGIADAAERYFGKEPEELTSDEAAQLAALLPAPRRGMDAAWKRRYESLIRRLKAPNERLPLAVSL